MDSSVDKKSEGDPSSDSDPHPKPDPNPESGPLGSAPSIVPKSQKSVRWNPDLTTEVKSHDSSPGSRIAWVTNRVGMMRDVVGRWRQRAGEASKTAESLAGNVWQHLKTGPSFTDVAMGRLAQGTKILAEGGYEKIFRQNFDSFSEEQLLKTYACYLSTSAGPVMGILYLSTAKLAFCSDSPLPYKDGDQTEWSYYKVMIPLHQLKAVNPSASNVNPAEKYIQAISVDNHEFWFMGFVNYDGAVIYLQDALRIHALQA